jgi:hypothetical protein
MDKEMKADPRKKKRKNKRSSLSFILYESPILWQSVAVDPQYGEATQRMKEPLCVHANWQAY